MNAHVFDYSLTAHRVIRFGTFTLFYVAQGIPVGLFSIAFPIFLTYEGATTAELSAFGGIITLPWAFKLVVGPFMDRFTFLSMGFRRPWVILAQTGLVLSMVGLTLISLPGNPSLAVITACAFVCNVFAASQDVATDGMAIDILEPDERGKANAFMAFGQVIGYSAFGAISGTLLVIANVATVAAIASVFLAFILMIAIFTRERSGEKLLPWTKGQASSVVNRTEATFGGVFHDLLRVLFLPMSLVLILMAFLGQASGGVAFAVYPKYAADILHISTDDYSQFVALIGVVAAISGVLIGPAIDKFGAKRFLYASFLGSALVHVAAWASSELGFETGVIATLYVVTSILGQVTFVALIAIFMTICWTRVSATQFAIYMSLANLSRTIGGFVFATVAHRFTLSQDFLIMAVLFVMSAVVVKFFNPRDHEQRMSVLENQFNESS